MAKYYFVNTFVLSHVISNRKQAYCSDFNIGTAAEG